MQMIEKYVSIDPQTAHALLEAVRHTRAAKHGIDRHAFLLGDHAVLSTQRLKLRNATVRDDDLAYLDEIIQTLDRLYRRGVAVLPITGYCYDPDSPDGTGYLFQRRAKGEELYDDAIMTKFVVWAQYKPEGVYLSTDLHDCEAADYLSSRTHVLSQAPQEHFDRFIHDMLQIVREDILIDCNGKSNFFYDPEAGFQYIDLDAHCDFYYGLAPEKPEIEDTVCRCAFVPCHYAEGTELFSHIALAEQALCLLGDRRLRDLKADNQIIFEKCRQALVCNEIPGDAIGRLLRRLKIFGC